MASGFLWLGGFLQVARAFLLVARGVFVEG